MAEGGVDQLRGDILPTLDKQFASGTIDAIHSNYMGNTIGGRARAMDAGGGLATAIEGTKFGDLNTALEAEYNLKKAKGEAAGSLDEYMEPMSTFDVFSNARRWYRGTTPGALYGPLAGRMESNLKGLGLSTGAAGFTDPSGGIYSTISDVFSSNQPLETKAKVFNEAQSRIAGAGGDPSLGMGRDLQKMVSTLEALHATMKTIAENTKPKGGGVPPAPSFSPARIGSPP